MTTTVATTGPVERARELAPRLCRHALETERQRTIPEPLAGELRAAGLFQLMAPASTGGLEAEPRTIIRTVEEISRADAAAGWTVMVGQGAGFLAWLDADAAATVVTRHPRPLIVGSMAPVGQAQPVDGTDGRALRVSGRWPYSSGCGLADLIFGGFRTANGTSRFGLFTRDQLHIHDTWRVVGLCGTGSHDFEARDIEVPAALTFDPFGPAREPGPLYRLPYMTFLMTAMAGFPLGAARRVVDEYRAVAMVKRTSGRVRLVDSPLLRADLARCETAVRAARAGVLDAADTVWREALAGVPSPRSRALFTGAVQHAMRTAVEVSDTALRACGESQLYERAPLQRCFRDIQAAAQHIAFGVDAQQRVGAALLGAEVPLAFL